MRPYFHDELYRRNQSAKIIVIRCQFQLSLNILEQQYRLTRERYSPFAAI
jgi:hypothetical protein